MSTPFRTPFIIAVAHLLMLQSPIATAQEFSQPKASDTNSLNQPVEIGNKVGGAVTQKELLETAGLQVSPTYDSLFQIASFRLTRVRQGESPVEESNDSDGALTAAMRTLIQNSKKGDKIYFEYIKCKGYDGTMRSMSALSFIIE